MVELVKYIVDQLVDDKSAVNITTEENDGVETITINVAEGDIGKVIGKQGKIAMSIRTLAKAVGIKEGKRYNIEIADCFHATSVLACGNLFTVRAGSAVC